MILLALDTSSEHGSVALGGDQGVLEIAALAPGQHSSTLHTHVIGLLDRHHLQVKDIEGYAVTSGPGGFTGVRVGLTAAKALAEATNRPLVAVSTLEVVAAAARELWHPESPQNLIPILDARRGQIFGAVYSSDGTRLRPVLPQVVCGLKALLEKLREAKLESITFCGTDLDRSFPEPERAAWQGAAWVPVAAELAGPLVQIARTRLREGEGAAAMNVEANYVRASDAELFSPEPL